MRVEQQWSECNHLLRGGGGVCEPRIARAGGRTRVLCAETLPNLRLGAFPAKEVMTMGDKLEIPHIIDNTGEPILARPCNRSTTALPSCSTGEGIPSGPGDVNRFPDCGRRKFELSETPCELWTKPGGSGLHYPGESLSLV
jgi:O-acetylhomoserine (thiol)-lyase